MAFALAYLACIPAFALVFHHYAGHFYHSTVKYEVTLRDDEQALADKALRAWVYHFERAHKRTTAESNGWKLSFKDVRPGFGKHDHEKFTYRLELVLEQVAPKEGRLTTNAGELIVYRQPATVPLPLNPPTGQEPTAFYYARIALPDLIQQYTKFDTMKLAPLPSPIEGWAFVQAPASLWADMEHYCQALDGSPSRTRGSYGRMLYLSAVTITTLGYGDIVPISSTTRTLVSLEAVVGIVLIGLFLNALSQEVVRAASQAATKPSETQPHTPTAAPSANGSLVDVPQLDPSPPSEQGSRTLHPPPKAQSGTPANRSRKRKGKRRKRR